MGKSDAEYRTVYRLPTSLESLIPVINCDIVLSKYMIAEDGWDPRFFIICYGAPFRTDYLYIVDLVHWEAI